MRRLAVLLLVAGCGGRVVTLSHPDLGAEASREDIVDAAGANGKTLDLATRTGDVVVEVAEGPPRLVARLRLMARTEAEAERLLEGFRAAGQRVGEAFLVRVEGEPARIAGTELRVEPLVSFVARVPPGQRLRVQSDSGRVEVKGAAGDCWLETSFGDVKVLGARGEIVRAKTSSGTVQVRDVEAGRIEVLAAFGDVRIEGVRGDVDVRVGSGDVVLADFRRGRCELATGFGDIRAQGSFAEISARTSSGRVGVFAEPGSRIERLWSLRSSFGDVEVCVPRRFHCELLAETSFGSVTSDVEVRAEGKLTDQRVRGEIGDGGGRLVLRTSSGDIRIRASEG